MKSCVSNDLAAWNSARISRKREYGCHQPIASNRARRNVAPKLFVIKIERNVSVNAALPVHAMKMCSYSDTRAMKLGCSCIARPKVPQFRSVGKKGDRTSSPGKQNTSCTVSSQNSFTRSAV